MQTYKYLIIGADAAGNSAVGQIRRNDKEGSIGILEKTQIIAYGACGLPYAISEEVQDFDSLIHTDGESFGKQNRADVLLNHEVIAVNTEKKCVTAKTPQGEKEFGYEKLMIGTGAPALRLPFIDYSSSRVFELKTVPDGRAIQKFIKDQNAKNIAIIGAGYIGLEAAENFRQMGLNVSIFEAFDRPVPRLPESFSKSIVSQMHEQSIAFYPNSKVKAVKDTGTAIKLELETGNGDNAATDTDNNFDMLLVAVGVRPATQFLTPGEAGSRSSSIEMERGAIVVNRKGQTSVADVYAGGDCAVVYHKLLQKNVYYPMGHTANKQGRIAGMNMSGEEIEFQGIVGTQVFKFFDRVYGLTGLSAREATEAGYDFKEASAMRPSRAGYYPGAEKVKMTLLVDKKTDVLLGAAMFGPLDSYGLIDAASALINMQATASATSWMDFAYAPPFAPVWNALISAAAKA